MHIFDILKTDHKEFQDLLDSIQAKLDTDEFETQEIRPLFEELSHKLFVHMKAEEAAVYSRMFHDEETKEFANEAQEEHEIIIRLLVKLEKAAEVDDQWLGRFKVLKNAIEHHIEEEETEGFESMRVIFTIDQFEEMGDLMVSKRENLIERGLTAGFTETEAQSDDAKFASSTQTPSKRVSLDKGTETHSS